MEQEVISEIYKYLGAAAQMPEFGKGKPGFVRYGPEPLQKHLKTMFGFSKAKDAFVELFNNDMLMLIEADPEPDALGQDRKMFFINIARLEAMLGKAH